MARHSIYVKVDRSHHLSLLLISMPFTLVEFCRPALFISLVSCSVSMEDACAKILASGVILGSVPSTLAGDLHEVETAPYADGDHGDASDQDGIPVDSHIDPWAGVCSYGDVNQEFFRSVNVAAQEYANESSVRHCRIQPLLQILIMQWFSKRLGCCLCPI